MWSTFIKLRLRWLNVSVDVFDLCVFVFVCQLSSTRRSSGDSQREDERRSRTGGHRSDGHRPIGELWRPGVDEWKWFLLSAPLLHHPSFPLLLRWALTASEVCGVTSQLWRRWSSSRFSTPKSSTTSRSSRPGLYITYIHVYLLHKFFILHTPGSVPGVINKTSPIYSCMRTICLLFFVLFLFCDR